MTVTAAQRALRQALRERKERQAAKNLRIEPKSFGQDVRGCEIVVGSAVAYNRSGNVDAGEVIAIITKPIRWNQPGGPKAGNIRIRNYRDQKISKVRWPSSILVIQSLGLPTS